MSRPCIIVLAGACLLAIIATLQVVRLAQLAQIGVPSSSDRVRMPAVGDTLADLRLRSLSGPDGTLSGSAGGACRVLVVFHSGCVWSRRLAESGAFRGTVEGVPVTWASMPDRMHRARAFVEENALDMDPVYMVRRWRDVVHLGVRASPSIIVVGPALEYLGELDEEVPRLPSKCHE